MSPLEVPGAEPPGTAFPLQVSPKIPPALARLEELASDLWYSWHGPARALFARLNPGLWDSVGRSPRALLRRVDADALAAAVTDPDYQHALQHVLRAYDAYRAAPPPQDAALGTSDLVAYFCAEYGFHESLPLYSGGLGILAADHCKTASDLHLPFVAVGLLYRQGYFQQAIDSDGGQRAEYRESDFDDLPIEPVEGAGGELRVHLELPGRRLALRVWRARAGRIALLLLDTDVPENEERDRRITRRLYGGDRGTRIEQEMVLGIGGVRTLAALGLQPAAWHVNEGHAAFLLVERLRVLLQHGLEFDAALEACAANTVFTTHTPVPAGHDAFEDEMVQRYFADFCAGAGITPEQFAALGRDPHGPRFNMTALAVRGSRFQNGVSRIHGGVSARILAAHWPEVPPEENPVGYITNAVHVPTFLAPALARALEQTYGPQWSERVTEPAFWLRIAELPDELFVNVRRQLKVNLLYLLRHRLRLQFARNQESESHYDRLVRLADPEHPDVLTIGFGRRFAAYKRAMLLFEDPDRLKRILGDPHRPVLFLFAGKAHPDDTAAQDLMRQIAQCARMPEFEGRILLVEGYDLHLGRRLVAGVDVWLNNPIYPLEASGTSGMKAGINGTINLSVLDGWWAEGSTGDNGWAIKPASAALEQYRRDREEARTLYELLQDHVIPLYYDARGRHGYSPGWVALAKRSIASLLPKFNSNRMLREYVERFYAPAARQGRVYADNGYAVAREIAQWKARVRAAWHGVSLRRLDAPPKRLSFGAAMRVEIAARLNGIAPSDLVIEVVMRGAPDAPPQSHRLGCEGAESAAGEYRFGCELRPEICGQLEYRIRAYPAHARLTHPFELGLMRWL
ncbi:MAG: alpha-glucan family phosphorylase [Betaproteobacteria bacterium]|nr:MAG: alpha-glucan family phosphorylase [Betaproteobacteria bacterium]